jgi:hypothetical protein
MTKLNKQQGSIVKDVSVVSISNAHIMQHDIHSFALVYSQ